MAESSRIFSPEDLGTHFIIYNYLTIRLIFCKTKVCNPDI